MTQAAIRVTAQWALRGKLRSDRGYRLLSYSDGVIGAYNFEELLTRYSPGTLEVLPQVSVSWIPASEADKSYLAIAIHEFPEGGQYDLDGRKIVYTRCFCTPYGQLADTGITYQVMYETFHNARLRLGGGGAPITAVFDSRHPEMPPDWKLTARVAECLLSGSPVCIIDGDRAEMLDRLRFIDSVMALLPYGLRSRMSASTWTSSTTQRHKFRLFFSNSPRVSRNPVERDHVLSWLGKPEHEQVGYFFPDHRGLAERYGNWLHSRHPIPLGLLAGWTEQMSFNSPRDIARMVVWAERMPRRPLALTAGNRSAPPRPADAPQTQDEDRRDPAPAGAGAQSDRPDAVETLLEACAQILTRPKHPGLREAIAELNKKLADPEAQDAGRRQRYWQIIVGRGLLHVHFAGPEVSLYDTFLRAAFGSTPRNRYGTYCLIEDSLDGRVHPALVEALERMGAPAYLQVIMHDRLADGVAMGRILAGRIDVCDLIEAVATEELRSEHLRVICNVIIRALGDASIKYKMAVIRLTLQKYGYLAAALQRSEPDDHQYQQETLSRLLLHAQGGKLSRLTARNVLSAANERAPTPDLLVAVTQLLQDEADTPDVLQAFAVAYARNAGFDNQVRDVLMHRFAREDRPVPATQVIAQPKSKRGPKGQHARTWEQQTGTGTEGKPAEKHSRWSWLPPFYGRTEGSTPERPGDLAGD